MAGLATDYAAPCPADVSGSVHDTWDRAGHNPAGCPCKPYADSGRAQAVVEAMSAETSPVPRPLARREFGTHGEDKESLCAGPRLRVGGSAHLADLVCRDDRCLSAWPPCG